MSAETDSPGAPGRNDAGPSPDGAGPFLPPPAFPPGARRVQVRRRAREATSDIGGALILPDDPLPERADVPDDAFISPDDPLPRRAPGAGAEGNRVSGAPRGRAREEETLDDADGVVTGIGDDAHLAPEAIVSGGDPHVRDLVARVGRLSTALSRRGEAGLRTTPEMDRFDATLRAYCVGYLAGRRAGEAASG